MRSVFVILLSCLALVAQPWLPSAPARILLEWDYPPDEVTEDLIFKLYTTSDPSVPMNQWALLTIINGWELGLQLDVAPGPAYFYLTASNALGESLPSNIAARREFLTRPDTFGIKLLPL